jgi:hypothetical protein
MGLRIHGRVIDTEGRPVAGARVLLDYDFAPEPLVGAGRACEYTKPSVALTNAAGEYVFTPEAHSELADKLREQQDRARAFRGEHLHALSVRATHDDKASQQVILDCVESTRVLDLVLERGVVGRVAVRWSDDALAKRVSVVVSLVDRQAQDVEGRAHLFSFEGHTDERGELAFGPVPDHEFRITVTATHPEAPPTVEWGDSRIPRDDRLELILPRGRDVCGRLVKAQGEPAVGYRVAPFALATGDPEVERAAHTDSTGHFTVAGVDPEDAMIAIYDEPAPKSSDPEGYFAYVRDRVGRLGKPLMIQEVPAGHDDLGTVTLPPLGTLTLRLEDGKGKHPLSGHAHWTHSQVSHGTCSSWAEADGILRLERIPLGVDIRVQVTFQDPEHGELEERVRIAEVKEETVTLRLTGAGTVIVRLHAKRAPREPLEVRDAHVHWHDCLGFTRDGPISELRCWVPPGRHVLELGARGYRKRVLKRVKVRDDGPTFLDVELEKR